MAQFLSLQCLQIWFTRNYVLNGLSYAIGHQFKYFVIIKSVVWGRTSMHHSIYHTFSLDSRVPFLPNSSTVTISTVNISNAVVWCFLLTFVSLYQTITHYTKRCRPVTGTGQLAIMGSREGNNRLTGWLLLIYSKLLCLPSKLNLLTVNYLDHRKMGTTIVKIYSI